MDVRAAIAAIGLAVNPLDLVDELTIGGGSRALRARPPGIITSRRDAERVLLLIFGQALAPPRLA
jgi:hypothetical protein